MRSCHEISVLCGSPSVPTAPLAVFLPSVLLVPVLLEVRTTGSPSYLAASDNIPMHVLDRMLFFVFSVEF